MDGYDKSDSKRKLNKTPFGNGIHAYDGEDEFSSPKGLEKPDKTKYNLFEAYGTVAVRSLLPANVERIGQVSGKQYYFSGAGSVLEVDERDVPHLLSLSIPGQSCCGQNRNAFNLFELA
jgi:hypothetical protein